MKIFIRQSAGKIASVFILAASIVLLPKFVFASSTNGTINSVYKYGWSENIAWINFGLSAGDIHVTDAGISGYAWSSNYGWINLNPPGSGVKNNGAGTFSGSAWGENTGWINFSGVSIDSDGYFNGYASGDVTGRISFNCSNTNSCADSDFKVQTDWRPRVVRPLCNNAIDDDNDGLIDYPNDLGCESLEDNDEINQIQGLSFESSNPPAAPAMVLINNGDEYTNSQDVVLTLFSNSDVENISISNSPDFFGVPQISFQKEISWNLCQGQENICGDKFQSASWRTGSKFQVYVKFYTKYGRSSEIVFGSIILDNTPPELKIDKIKDYYREDEDIILTGGTEKEADIILHGDEKYSLIKPDSNGYWKINLGKMPAGDYVFDIIAKDLAKNKSQPEIIELSVKPVEKEEVQEEKAGGEKTQEGVVEIPPKAPAGESIKADTIFKKIEDAASKIISKIIDFIKPFAKAPKIEEPQKIVTISEKPPLAFQKKWVLVPREAVNRFALAPLPKEFQKLAEKFPKLEKTFEQVGIKKITDLQKLASVKLTLPGLMESVGVLSGGIKTGGFASAKPVPLAQLSPQLKQQLPTEIIFANTGSELIDFNIALSINEKGQPQQQIRTVSGKPLHLIVKPDNPVKSVKGYLVFKSKAVPSAYERNSKTLGFKLSLNNLLNSMIFANPVFAYDQEKPVRVEEKLVLMEFEYTDPDGDGIYTAEIQAPLTEGEYEVITVLEFEDPELGRKEIRLVTVVDPEGYIYENAGGKETRIPGAIVSIYSLNPATKQYEIWPAGEYQQENPQATNNTGKYSFLVPEGFYYLEVNAPGYLLYQGKPFEVKEGSGVHQNIELRTKYWWTKIVDWKTAALIVVILFLMYNFYRDRKRERNLKREIVSSKIADKPPTQQLAP
ncbi:MAG: carboxypeptidase-like regulatory domain-containing protein [bacterium]